LRRQSLTIGGVLSQAIDSFMPWAIGPQAVVCAERLASFAFAADASAQFWLPW